MSQVKPSAGSGELITRDALLDGSFLKGVRAAAARIGKADRIRSDEQIKDLVAEFWAARPHAGETWVFAYGSLMWNPSFDYTESRRATVRDWHRQFCLWSPIGRGTAEKPCLVLALDAGGQSDGIAFRLPAGREPAELELCFRREMFSPAYLARWVDVDTPEGPRTAAAFVANHDFPLYAGSLSREEIAAAIAIAKGAGGSCADYLFQTLAHLDEAGIEDADLREVARLTQLRLGDQP